jgi:hypothetical protein
MQEISSSQNFLFCSVKLVSLLNFCIVIVSKYSVIVFVIFASIIFMHLVTLSTCKPVSCDKAQCVPQGLFCCFG